MVMELMMKLILLFAGDVTSSSFIYFHHGPPTQPTLSTHTQLGD